MPINSKSKGARGERLWRDVLRSRGLTARRGQQYCGGNGDADVVCEELSDYHFEVKFTNTLRMREAIEQAKSDAREGKIPVVVHKADKQDWMVIMDANAFLHLAIGLSSAQKMFLNPHLLVEATKEGFSKSPYEKILDKMDGIKL